MPEGVGNNLFDLLFTNYGFRKDEAIKFLISPLDSAEGQ
jgi:hypothetical protein